MITPSEDYESIRFAAWLLSEGYQCPHVEQPITDAPCFSHIAHETKHLGPVVGAKFKRMGKASGVPDYVICLKRGGLLWIEMKRRSGGKESPQQEVWRISLRRANCQVMVCKGFDEAVAAVRECESGPT